jgi:ribosomal protein S3AE
MAQLKKRKRFFDVEIPLIKKETQAIAYALEELEGRHIKYDLTRILRGKSIILQSKIKIEKDKAIAYPKQIQLMPYYLKRMIRKGTNYVEDSFSTKTKDAQVRIKPFLVTRRKVSRAVRKALREKAREELIEYLKTKTTEELFQEVLRNILQKTLSLKLKKIYPLSLCEIRRLKVEKELEKQKAIKKETKKKS